MSNINHEHRHVFIHVPKTAGTSMERLPWVGGSGHATANRLVPQTPAYFSWGFVRNPYDRLLSVYSAYTQHCKPGCGGFIAEPFEQVVMSLRTNDRPRPHFAQQHFMLCWWRSGEIAVDFVGRYECLDQDWQTVCERIGVDHKPLPHRNGSNHLSWQDVYTSEMLAVVNDVYRRDFLTFNYDMLEAL